MCGIFGIWSGRGGDAARIQRILQSGIATLGHRGPDADGIWRDEEVGVGLAHARLSILDLTSAGAQPMHGADGRFVVTFNGEIYNHLDIRDELAAAGAAALWRGHSDTETLLAAVAHWGLAEALRRFSGMFAFALWDQRERSLHLCRDRFGEKPLYYGWIGGAFAFASELKALAAHPDWPGAIDRNALTAFMRYSYVPAPHSIWQGVFKLPAGSFLRIDAGAVAPALPTPQPYWSMREEVARGARQQVANEVEAIAALETALTRAVGRQCLSDVPLGAFLSGGIDSSTIVALMQKQISTPVRTFSIGFTEAAFDEAADAKKVAAHLCTDHTELYVTPDAARAVIPSLADMYDEPFADSSQIPTHLVAKLARGHVTVALTGDAGDEMFGGYNRHIWGGKLSRLFALPRPIRLGAASMLGALAPQPIGALAALAEPVLPQRLRVRRAGDQAVKLARIFSMRSFDDMYRLLCSIEAEPSRAVLRGHEAQSWADAQMADADASLDPLGRMTLADALSYLGDDILQKVDRAAMAVSLETRVPFLDKSVVELACRVPAQMKVRDGRGKWLVRQVLYRHVPAALVDRPKTGFSIPIDDWLRGPLRGWMGDLLSPERLRRQGLFDPDVVAGEMRTHLSGTNRGYWLWNVLMAQAWVDRWAKRGTPAG